MGKKDFKKRKKLIEEQKRDLNKADEKNKCSCYHCADNGDLDIQPLKDRKEGELKFVCKRCGKILDFNRIEAVDLETSSNTIDNAIDIIKTQLNPRNEKESDIIGKLAEFQFFVRNQVSPLYENSLKKNSGGNRNKNRGNDNNSAWTKPEVRR